MTLQNTDNFFNVLNVTDLAQKQVLAMLLVVDDLADVLLSTIILC